MKNIEYVCVKTDDVKQYLTVEQQNILFALVNLINKARIINKKSPLKLTITDARGLSK